MRSMRTPVLAGALAVAAFAVAQSATDAGIHHADAHVVRALLALVRAVRGGADLLHVPLQAGERIGRDLALLVALLGLRGFARLPSARALDGVALGDGVGRRVADRLLRC